MATDYDAPRKSEEDQSEESIEELKARRHDKNSGKVDEDETEAAESFELPGADLSHEELAVEVEHAGELLDPATHSTHDLTAAAGSSLTDGGRLLSVADPASPPGMATFTEPLGRGGSLVLVRNPDPDRLDGVYDAERATVRA